PGSARPAAARRRFPAIAAVGASAGGLEAFTELLTALPRDAAQDMAFVFLQHLQPSHPSLLPELLQRSTFLAVEEARDGVLPEPGYVYVLPAAKEMVLRRGRLKLSARKGHEISLPIDLFMRSLAAERKSAAIGVVLAGTASDGTLGLTAIKAEGGICFAQSEGSTQFNGMARSAIASGCVDFVLPPADIARELARIGRHPYVAGAEAQRAAEIGLNAGSHRAYVAILEIVRRETGMDFAEYRSSTIERRIARRMALHTLERPEDYLRYLHDYPREVAQLGEDILIPATRFFRDPEVFEALKNRILAPLVRQRRRSSQPIRLWSAGCSTGEETYSLAMIALECLGETGGGGVAVQIFGTDLNETVVRRARAGRYGLDLSADISPERLQRFFIKTESGYQVGRALRDACIFARHNAVREAPFSRLDLICCRNVMIYMEPPLQRRLLSILHYALTPGGVLVLGTAESTSATPRLFRPAARLGRKLKMFTKQGVSRAVDFSLGENPPAAERAVQDAASAQQAAGARDIHREADSILLSQFAPPGVIVDANLEVLEFRGRCNEFLELAPGAASLNLLKLAPGDLGAYVRSAVLQARRRQATVRVEG
ncbi:MAG: CheR family methyltransferase, partial [Terriglobales bacterium]